MHKLQGEPKTLYKMKASALSGRLQSKTRTTSNTKASAKEQAPGRTRTLYIKKASDLRERATASEVTTILRQAS